jgi:hypothetical protein
MKKIFSFTSIVIAAIALITISCEKTPEELLIGKWEVQYVDVMGYVNNVLVIDSTATYDPGEMQLEFFEGGTGKEYENGDLNDTFTWVVNGDKVTVTVSGSDPMEFAFTVGKSAMSYTMTEEWTEGDISYKIVMIFNLKRL